MTRSLQKMMVVTDEIISQLQQDSTQNTSVPTPIQSFIHTQQTEPMDSTSSDSDYVITQPKEELSTNHGESNSHMGPDIESHGSSAITVSTIQPSLSSHNSSKNLADIGPDPFVQLLDDIRYKREGDYRIILQNTNGIKEFRNSNPDYLPTMCALQQAGLDHMCLDETNTAWYANDFLYDITMVNQHIWNTPTKTVGASCRKEKFRKSAYQPGGCTYYHSKYAHNKNKYSVYRCPWEMGKDDFFAKSGSFVIFIIYRPNPGSLAYSGIDSAWMQQYRALSQNNKEVDPGQKLIDDLIEDVLKKQAMNGTILLAGDFNEDMEDGHTEGIAKLISTCGLKNAFKEVKGHMHRTRNNRRVIDHFFISKQALHLATQTGVLPDETSFTSDHACLCINVSPAILECKNQHIPPSKQRKLKCYNKVNVEKYVTYALEKFEAQNIVKRLQRLHQQIADDVFDAEAGDTLNTIDKIVTEIMLRSEHRLSPEETPYACSIELERQIRIVRLIKRIQDQKALNYPLETYVNSNLEAITVELIHMDDTKLDSTLTEERTKFISMQNESWSIRERHHNTIIEKGAKEQSKDMETIGRDMKFREIQKRTFERVGRSLKTSNFAQITRLGIPKHLFMTSTEEIWDYIQSTPDEVLKTIEWDYTEDANEIVYRLLKWNIHHFNQAHTSPLASKYWQVKLNPINKTDDELDGILHHTLLNGEDLSAETIYLLEQIHYNIQPTMSS